MKLLRGDLQKSQSNDDCRVLAPYVMTLFDGEADEFEARRARAHLLVCQTCARRWLDWNRSRDLLCSAPVPAPPPHLLWRVLMACRLASAPASAPAGAQSPATSRTATSRTASNSEFPAELSARILARTTRQALPATRAPWSLRAASALRMPALAVPALGVWMLILQRDVWLPAPVVLSPSVPTRAARFQIPRREAFSASATSASATRPPASGHAHSRAQTTSSPVPTSPALAGAMPEATRFKASGANASHIALRGRRSNLSEIQSAIALAARTPGLSHSPGFLTAGLNARAEGALQRALLLAAPPATPPDAQEFATSIPSESDFSAPRSARRGAASRARAKKLALSNSDRMARLREPRFGVAPLLSTRHASGATNRTPRAALYGAEAMTSPQVLRVSVPSARAPQPSRLLAENIDSDDDRLDEARSVVDDFRATLGSDDASTDAANADVVGDENW